MIVPDKFQGKTIALHITTKDDGWDAINPQFALYLDGKLIQGKRTKAVLKFFKPLQKVVEANMLESELREIEYIDNKIQLEVRPYEIITLKVNI